MLRTDQVPALAEALSVVAARIDGLWASDGDAYTREVISRSPDPQEPAVAREQQLARLGFIQLVADNLPQVTRLLTDAASTDAAVQGIASLLGFDEADVLGGLARFDLLALTRPATERRRELLEG